MNNTLEYVSDGYVSEPDGGSARLRIAIVTPELSLRAGVPHYWSALARVLASRHDVHVFTSTIDGAAPAGVRVHRLPAVRVGWVATHASFYVSARLRFALARLLQRERFDVVLGVGALTPFADVATAHFSQEREVELQRSHAYPPERPTLGFAAADYALYGRLMRWLERRYYRRTDKRVVAISRCVRDDLVERLGVPPQRVTIVPNGVDAHRFHPGNRERYREQTRAELGVGGHDIAALFVGHSWGRKGLRTAIDAVVGLRPYPARLVVVGDGSPRAFLAGRPAWQRERVIFVGSRARAVERYYAAADVFVFPTLYEPFGLVIMEALASGLPAIVSARAGAAQLLVDGEDALLLDDPGDAGELRRKMAMLIDDHELAAQLALRGRRVAERFTWRAIADQLLRAAVPAPAA